MGAQNPPPPNTSEEQSIWKGTPSQSINLGVYLLCAFAILIFAVLIFYLKERVVQMVLAGGIGLALVIAFVRWLKTRCRIYELTTQRLRTSNGIFSRRTDEFELYRVKDTTLVEPFYLRAIGAGNIVISTNDASTPSITLEAIKRPQELREQIRKYSEICRDRKQVRVTEME